MQTILTVVSQPEGALELLQLDDFSALIEIAPQYHLVLDIFSYTWLNASTIDAEIAAVRENIDKVIPVLLSAFQQTDGVTLIGCLGKVLPRLIPEVGLHESLRLFQFDF